ncbi:MAG: MFS transporter [bacterium]
MSVIQPIRREKWVQIGLLAAAEFLAMTLWFSASAVVPQLTIEWNMSGTLQSWITMSVQIGFVLGALLSALLNLADRIPARRLFTISALAGAAFNLAIPAFCDHPLPMVLLRFATGITLAGVYPVGMKLIATWCREDRGLGIGILVGALTLGKAVPHLLNALPILGEGGMPPWRSVLAATSSLALLSALIAVFFIKTGPFLSQSAHFDWHFSKRVFMDKPTRLANFGYLGHMWELYAVWTWVPIFLIASYEASGWNLQAARLAAFGVVGLGALGCTLAGAMADRLGRTTVTVWSLVISGACALTAGLLFSNPALLTILCLIWGFAVVADSAQFSTAVSELTDPRYVGTALTLQTSIGFLLTMVTIRLIPVLVDWIGWEFAFMLLSIGPAFGIWSMLRLRSMPEASKMASGNR